MQYYHQKEEYIYVEQYSVLKISAADQDSSESGFESGFRTRFESTKDKMAAK
jgi:hypothetical protein